MDLSEVNPENPYRHPWESSRSDALIGLFADHAGTGGSICAADIGAGDLFFAHALQKKMTGTIYAVDIHYPEERKAAEEEGIVTLRQAEDLPGGAMDVIFLMDVLEHIDFERPFLGQIHDKLKDDGLLFITVPAFAFLFSSHDEALHHYRRYAAKDLIALIRDDYVILEGFYFYSVLFFMRLLEKTLEGLRGLFHKKRTSGQGAGFWKYPQDHFLTRSVEFVLNTDFKMNRFLGRHKIKTFGLSLCLICRKKSH